MLLMLCVLMPLLLLAAGMYVASKHAADKSLKIILEIGTLVIGLPAVLITCAALLGLGG